MEKFQVEIVIKLSISSNFHTMFTRRMNWQVCKLYLLKKLNWSTASIVEIRVKIGWRVQSNCQFQEFTKNCLLEEWKLTTVHKWPPESEILLMTDWITEVREIAGILWISVQGRLHLNNRFKQLLYKCLLEEQN